MGILIVAAIVLIVVIFVVANYNGLVKIKNRLEEAFSTMDVYLKKRYDLIPNLVQTVKGYATHEKETLTQVIEARNQAVNSSTPAERLENEKTFAGALSRLFALAESYPDLKADSQFLNLQGELSKIENDIAQSRKFYNAVAKQMNNKVMMFPSNIIAGMFHFERAPYYEIDESERENVKVEF